MKTHLRILVVMGIVAALFILAGCSSNPMTSTQTIPVVDNSSQESDNNQSDPGVDNGYVAGHDAEVTTDVEKYDNDNNEVESFPAPGN